MHHHWIKHGIVLLTETFAISLHSAMCPKKQKVTTAEVRPT